MAGLELTPNGLSPFGGGSDKGFDKSAFVAAWACATTYKPIALEIFARGLPPGAIILDAGIGSGIDIPFLSKIVGQRGKVVGIDTSLELLQGAEQLCEREELAEVALCQIDMHALPFADETFDAVRTDRTLQHIADPRRALEEMVRVLKCGGTLVASDPDWDRLSIHHLNTHLTQQILAFKRDVNIRNGYIAEASPVLLQGLGLKNVTTVSVTDHFQTPQQIMELFYIERLLGDMVQEGNITQQDATDWIQQLGQGLQEGEAICDYTTTITSGEKA